AGGRDAAPLPAPPHAARLALAAARRLADRRVEQQVVEEVLPPLTQLRVLHINWNIVTHGPPDVDGGDSSTSGGGGKGVPGHMSDSNSSGGGGGSSCSKSNSDGGGSRWRLPALPLLEELSVAWMRE
ncbi:hypothetical protein Agub_g11864, partial [Astrephomene gubernaculifera]